MEDTRSGLVVAGLIGVALALSACGGGSGDTQHGLNPHQSWQAGYETAQRDYHGMFIPREMQQQQHALTMEPWCTPGGGDLHPASERHGVRQGMRGLQGGRKSPMTHIASWCSALWKPMHP